MRYQALFVAGFLEVYAFEYYKSDQMVVFDVAYLFELRLPQLFLWLQLCRLICCSSVSNKWRPELGYGQNSSSTRVLACGRRVLVRF